MTDRGLIISKTVFILRSTYDIEELPDVLLNNNSSNTITSPPTTTIQSPPTTITTINTVVSNSNTITSNNNNTAASNSINTNENTARVVCSACSCTFLEGTNCLRCEQSAAYNNSLNIDQTLPQSGNDDPPASPDHVLLLRELRERRMAHLSSTNVNFNNNDTAAAASDNNSNTAAASDNNSNTAATASDSNDPNSFVVRIRRSNVVSDLINAFKGMDLLSTTITYKFVDPRGEVEKGTGIGVTRDVYSSFWGEIMSSTFIGVNSRVPEVTHSFYKDEWVAVAEILCKGFTDVGYFPILLSEAFAYYALFDEPSDDLLLSSFLLFVSASERKMLEELVDDPGGVDPSEDELSEFLEEYKCRSVVNASNFRAVLIQLARQELIQKPHIMAVSWRTVFESHLLIVSPSELREIYTNAVPSTKSMLAMLKCEPTKECEQEAFGFLTRYIRSIDARDLKLLLQFLTGSDLVLSSFSKIEVVFVEFPATENNAARRPLARTCVPLLELPSTYSKFSDLRSEFEGIIRAGTQNWEMNVI